MAASFEPYFYLCSQMDEAAARFPQEHVPGVRQTDAHPVEEQDSKVAFYLNLLLRHVQPLGRG